MMNVLHVLPRMPVGGVGAFLLNIEKFLDRKKFHFEYLVIEDIKESSFEVSVKKYGSSLYLLNEALRITNSLVIYNKIDEFLRNNAYKYDIVHLHSSNIGMLIFPLAKKYGIKVRILHSHSTKYSDTILKSIRNYLLEFLAYNYTTHFLTCSNLAAKGFCKEFEYSVIYNGVEYERFKFKNIIKKNSKMIIGHVGNFFEVKNHVFIINLMRDLYKRNKNFELWLIGTGPLETRIKDLVSNYRLEKNIKFLGRVENVEEYYSYMDVFILPSLYEGFPVSLMEAQANGLQILASDSITREVDFFHDCVFLPINNGNNELWINKIMSVNNKFRYEKSIAFGKSEFNLLTTVKRLEYLYEKFVLD